MIQNSCAEDERQKANYTKGMRQLGLSACFGGSSQHWRTAPPWLILGGVMRKLLKTLKLEGAADQIHKLLTWTNITYPKDLASMWYSWKPTQLTWGPAGLEHTKELQVFKPFRQDKKALVSTTEKSAEAKSLQNHNCVDWQATLSVFTENLERNLGFLSPKRFVSTKQLPHVKSLIDIE